MDNKIYIVEESGIAEVARALDSELRRKILSLLNSKKMNINQIAEELNIPQSTCAVNVQILEKANLIYTEQLPAIKGSQKICSLRYDEVVIPLKNNTTVDDKYLLVEMPIGLYTDFRVSPPCGLVNDKEIIGYFDVVDSFLNPKRATAGLIWFAKGYLEYRFPKEKIVKTETVTSFSISTEICSEFPGYNNDWPSAITLWFNDVEIGTWISPGDMGGEYGRLTPIWWDLKNSQFGFLKSWKITKNGSFIDGVECSGITIEDLHIEQFDFFKIRIGIKENAEYQGGLNLFGRSFGNYEQDIILKIEIEKK